ncbi:predicted protein [Nematostella vectensis]|uniref:Uncharacterized protein n=1 Tax=Nematostella vectensis TaxID=45351 RepID=A7T3A2_NEMVE|nr:predicted protein [Nematostella vectensis]|eukprot:XP_001621662.1 hypothetical protein NEMVEDRAFT_v1g221732 [Nematostella vectensis]
MKDSTFAYIELRKKIHEVYHCKHETAKAEYQKAMDELISKQKEPKAKLPKLESPLPTGKPKFSIPKVSTAAKEGGKPEGARIKIPKKTSNSVVKPEGAAKSSSPQAAVGPFSLAPSTTASNMISKTLPSKPKATILSRYATGYVINVYVITLPRGNHVVDLPRAFYVVDLPRAFYVVDLPRAFYVVDLPRAFYVVDLPRAFYVNGIQLLG